MAAEAYSGEDRGRQRGSLMILVLLYVLTIPAANWLIGHVGTTCVPDGPCLIPVLPGLMAPSGVLMIGAALLLRDLVQRRYGPAVSLAAIAAGVVISFVVAPPALALASAAAFAISELCDFAVYTPLVRRGFALAVILSCVAGAAIDSAAFLWLAFGSLQHVAGQVVGKTYAAVAFLAYRRLSA